VAATIAGMSRAERYQDFAGAVRVLVKTATVKHLDAGNAGGDKPASGSAASGCMSPVPCGSIGFHPSAAACWRASPASWFTIIGSPTYTMEGVLHALPTICANFRSRSRKRTRMQRHLRRACHAGTRSEIPGKRVA
jgi:hypothetical protein